MNCIIILIRNKLTNSLGIIRLNFYCFTTDYDYDFHEPRPRNPIKSSHDDPWLHIHKEEAARSALLFGVGVLKGVAVTALINNANNGVTIGK